MSRQRTIITTAGIMLGLFMASMEATVVATAMPTIVSQLGGLAIYSWVFSVYMITSTTMTPIYGKFSDIYGRRPIFAAAMGVFLLGSVLSGMAQNMGQLIAFRAIQGLGAGGVMPMVFIIVGDIFSVEQRARMQGLFSGVWGVSSVVGPLLGGFLVDQASWRWIFYINVVPGAIAVLMVWLALQDQHVDRNKKPVIDFAGAALLSAGVVCLLMGLFELETSFGWALLVAAIALLAALYWVEKHAVNPILPLHLFQERLFAAATLNGVLTGWAMFGSLSFVPLFVQAVLGTSATGAGSTLTPMLLGWVISSIIGSRALLRVNYRTVILIGMSLLTVGALLLARANADVTQLQLMISLGLMGIGMGLTVSPFLIAVQSKVAKRDLGTATSTLQFSRSIGGALGVSVMGVVLSTQLAVALTAAGMDPSSVKLESLLDPVARSNASAALNDTLRAALATSIQGVFVIAFIAALLGLGISFLAPGGHIAAPAAPAGQTGGQTSVAQSKA